MYWNDAQWWAWIPMTLVMVAFWGLLAWFVVRLATNQQTTEGREPSALAILDARLARGEIDAAEYRALRELLNGHGARTM